MVANSTSRKRSALLASFAKLVLSRRYHEVSVASIAAGARTARSTFYYHFQGKNELLLENLTPLFAAIAASGFEAEPPAQLKWWVEHIWEYRVRARQLFDGRTGAVIEENLLRELQERIRSELNEVGSAQFDPNTIAIASGVMAILRGWLASKFCSSAEELALAIHRFTRATIQSRNDSNQRKLLPPD